MTGLQSIFLKLKKEHNIFCHLYNWLNFIYFFLHFSESSLQHFAIVSNNTRALDFDSLYENLSVDDCAQACLDTTRFQCQGFSYCDPSLNCMMLKTRPNNMTSQRTTTSAFCYMYQRKYLLHVFSCLLLFL